MNHKESSADLFFEEIPSGDTATPPVAPAAPAASVTPEVTPVSTNSAETPKVPAGDDATGGDTPASGKEAMVPSHRLKEEADKRRQLEEKVAALEAEKSAPTQTDPEDDDTGLDPEAEKAIEKLFKKRGFVTKTELEAEREASNIRAQVERDIADLTKEVADKGLPAFEKDAVVAHATEVFGPNALGSKAAIKMAYESLHKAAIDEANKKAILAEAQNPTAEAERPGAPAGSVSVTTGDEKKGLDGMISSALKSIRSGK